jgi:hypothetical protein
MVTVLLWVLGVFAVAVILLFLYGFYLGFTDQTTYRAVVSLYDIRRRMQVAQLKTELRRDAADLRRALQRDLDEQGKL